ncbi:phosphoribosylaminoimidazole carboxylase catalytic subunit [Anaplasma centrale str. Israel]|uniref:N5-carboxyaminoimidazole ribonucleotide mutase n=1 Tax=Anaplasma centrale (strain Israel) TaxID=574556 RepID=D1AT52_ANACI|nr:5-(carboxyamino)imidazole ribonucleotide mutase [Anaplasma centrale]ACZ48730.1 phosphoribosylaminoimidazole carboxylase catalytic subunit [Anaplasma centrale str. Israel]
MSGLGVQVSVVMGSKSDFPTMSAATLTLDELRIEFEVMVVSAHRTPERLYDFAKTAHTRGIKVIIAGAGGAAHLPGMVAALASVPVVGVPIRSEHLNGLDSLLSIVQMPKGTPVATMSIGAAGAANAAVFAASILGLSNADVQRRLVEWRAKLASAVKVSPFESEG